MHFERVFRVLWSCCMKFLEGGLLRFWCQGCMGKRIDMASNHWSRLGHHGDQLQ